MLYLCVKASPCQNPLQFFKVLVCHKRPKSFLEFIHRQLLTFPLLQTPIDSLGWDEDVIDNLNYAIRSYTIFDGNRGKSVNLDADKTTVPRYINAE